MDEPQSKGPAFWIRIKDLIDRTHNQLSEISRSGRNWKIDTTEKRVAIHMIHRATANYFAMQAISTAYLNTPKLRFSLFSLLRPVVMDCITFLYLISDDPDSTKGMTAREGFTKKYNTLAAMFYTKFGKLIEGEIRDGDASAEELKEFYKTEAAENPELFDAATGAPLSKGAVSDAKTMVDRIRKGSLGDLASIYSPYFMLSQYEHYTRQTEVLMDTDFEADHHLIRVSTVHILIGLTLCVRAIDPMSPFVEQLIALKDELAN